MANALPTISLGNRTIAIDVPHLVFATAIAGWAAWFCRDAWLAQADVENMIMILPAAVLAVILYGFVAAECFHVIRRQAAPLPPQRKALAPGVRAKVVGTMVLLGAYAVGAPLIGFDVTSFAVLAAMLLLLGERRVLVVVGVPALFSAVTIYCFGTLLATPLPLFFISGDSP
jgi:hypothetical protein